MWLIKKLTNIIQLQYLLTIGTLLLLINFSGFISNLFQTISLFAFLSIISWLITKKIRKYYNNNKFVTSYKRAVLITGCDSGFGNALAQTLNEHGFRVYATVLDTDSDGAKKLATSARFDGMTTVLRMDVTNDEEVNAVYEQIAKELQQNGEQLWAVVNNAGLFTSGPLDWGTVDSYKRIFEVNTFGTVRVARTFLPLIRQSKGRIVNLVSICGRFTSPNVSIYSMSKHAVTSFSDALRRETTKWGIKVSTIEPTIYKTPMATTDYQFQETERLWSETSDSVQQVYGRQYCTEFMKLSANKRFQNIYGQNINDVIDKLVDAVRNVDPQISYEVVPNYLWSVFLFVEQLLPYELSDWMNTNRLSSLLFPVPNELKKRH
ncbi:D-beta-hydroxybutyrate dehydrogenase, mitochondrial-like [Oppia nitens]|uniref:D-beta-hydroxybutyrate dehydrogenase, mitochondrial-like n=1 Tax=Oppia nitens TaxID=1686743 RepID=UPI0023DC183F|nr:D-beta-hydroxybutyrate dehydrogenase, mitochondrial-like [Oppia nitens]